MVWLKPQDAPSDPSAGKQSLRPFRKSADFADKNRQKYALQVVVRDI